MGCERCRQLESDLDLERIKAMNLREDLAKERELVQSFCDSNGPSPPTNEYRKCAHCRERFTTGVGSPNQYCISCQALQG